MEYDETEKWTDRDDFQHLELLWRLPDKGKEKDYAQLRVAVDGRSKAFVVSFRVRQAATTTTVPAPTPVSPPVLKLLHRDRNMFECSWTDSMLQSPSGVEYVLQMCALGSTRWHSRRHGPPTGRRRLGGRPGPPSVS